LLYNVGGQNGASIVAQHRVAQAALDQLVALGPQNPNAYAQAEAVMQFLRQRDQLMSVARATRSSSYQSEIARTWGLNYDSWRNTWTNATQPPGTGDGGISTDDLPNTGGTGSGGTGSTGTGGTGSGGTGSTGTGGTGTGGTGSTGTGGTGSTGTSGTGTSGTGSGRPGGTGTGGTGTSGTGGTGTSGTGTGGSHGTGSGTSGTRTGTGR
jgi:hypothetical protein